MSFPRNTSWLKRKLHAVSVRKQHSCHSFDHGVIHSEIDFRWLARVQLWSTCAHKLRIYSSQTYSLELHGCLTPCFFTCNLGTHRFDACVGMSHHIIPLSHFFVPAMSNSVSPSLTSLFTFYDQPISPNEVNPLAYPINTISHRDCIEKLSFPHTLVYY